MRNHKERTVCKMEVVFEIVKSDITTIEEIRSSVDHIRQDYLTNGLDGVEIVAIVVALVPAIKDIILKYIPNKSVTIKISNEYGSVEISAKSVKEAEEQVEAYLQLVEKMQRKETK